VRVFKFWTLYLKTCETLAFDWIRNRLLEERTGRRHGRVFAARGVLTIINAP
jgi:hypothetical protein